MSGIDLWVRRLRVHNAKRKTGGFANSGKCGPYIQYNVPQNPDSCTEKPKNKEEPDGAGS